VHCWRRTAREPNAQLCGPDLEDQACTWTPADRNSPGRVDAMCHGINFLEPKLRGPRYSTATSMAHWSKRVAG